MTSASSFPSIVRGLTTGLLPLCLGLAGVPAAQAQVMMRPQPQSSSLMFPERGVVCDPLGQVCYDQKGVSLGLTRTFYGPRAEADLVSQFTHQPMPREFRLSDGSVCSLVSRTCWSDGWGRRNVNAQLASQLFGGNQVLSKENGFCRLDDWGFRVYNGRCRLIRAVGNPEFTGGTYTVRLPNNNEVILGNRNGYVTVRNAGRNWPAQFQDLGNNTALIRWGTKQLLVNTITYGPGDSYTPPPLPSTTFNTPYRNSYSGSGVNWNGAIEGLLNGLFNQ